MMPKRKIVLRIVLSVVVILCILAGVWQWRMSARAANAERLARQHCSSCHAFPEPSLLNKRVWAENIIPQMAFRMGFKDYTIITKFSPDELPRILATLPAAPLVTREELQSITRYYYRNAPRDISLDETTTGALSLFQPAAVNFGKPYITMLKADTLTGTLWVGTQSAWLYTVNEAMQTTDSLELASPPSHAIFEPNKTTMSLLGALMPSDEATGKVATLTGGLKPPLAFFDSLQRPVYFHKDDLNADGQPDYVVCAFGNYTGYLALFAGKGDTFVKHVLSATPGARKVAVEDINGDGKRDIIALMAQGDERMVLYTNRGNSQFDEKVILRFPPVYGSNYFELTDFNGDGHKDILFTNGDNGDYSIILKPYHGVRLFLNDGQGGFSEKWFFPMPGASQAMAEDFDKDGDIDIAAISFFPDFDRHPERSFIYFNNTGNNTFQSQTTPMAADGRWLVMEKWDYDHDGDLDLFLGASSYRGLGASYEMYARWAQKKLPLMMLKNELTKK